MRGVAALLVAFFHLRYGVIGIPWFDAYIFSYRFGGRGYLWVDFFFILSGFILAYRYGSSCRKLSWKGYGHFVWQRIARIWPLHLVTVAIAILYLGITYGPGYLSRDAIVANLLLVHSWGRYFPPPLDFPSWSLSCEWGAYLILPLYLFAIGPFRRGVFHLFLVAVLLALLYWYATQFGKGTLDRLREQWGLGRCILEVAMGVSLFELSSLLRSWQASRKAGAIRWTAMMFDAIAAVVFGAIFVVFTYTGYDFYFVPLAVGLIFCLSVADGPFSFLLQRPVMILLGEISFSIYMLHGFVLWLCQDIPTSFKARLPFWVGALWLLAAHLIVIGLSYLSFKLIERPAHRALTGRWRSASLPRSSPNLRTL